ncbi:TetR/AcrR family transcriptional regulator [Amorphus sp. MBR-141]
MSRLTDEIDDQLREAPVETPRRGRPKKGEGELVTERIVVAATNLFLDNGFAETNMDTIAVAAGCSKRTLYTRFPSKDELFETVMLNFMRTRLKLLELSTPSGSVLYDRLTCAGETCLELALSPAVIQLHRLLVSESAKFPKLSRIFEAVVWEPALAFFVGILQESPIGKGKTKAELRLLAGQFVALVVERPFRHVVIGLLPPKVTPQMRRETKASVKLFLDGCGLG